MELRSNQTMTYLCDVKDVKRGLMRGEAIRIQATGITGWMIHVLLPSKKKIPTHTGWMSDDLLHSKNNCYTQGGCVTSYFPVKTIATHREDV